MEKSNLDFIGSIPYHYDKDLGPIIFEDYAQDLANRVSVDDGGKVLEIAAGTGILTKALRDRLAQDIDLVVTDLNLPMLEFAMSKFNDPTNMIFQTEDATKLSFQPGTFDAIVSQFSIMFFPDKLESLKEARRVLKAGGEYIFNVWDSLEHNHIARTVNEIIIGLYPNNPIKFYEVAYGTYQIDVIKNLLEQAGFKNIKIDTVQKFSQVEKAQDVATAFILGNPVSLQIQERGKIEIGKVLEIVEKTISEIFGPQAIKENIQAIIFKATA